MPPQVVAGATAMCSFGAAPASLVVLPMHQCLAGSPAANVTDQASGRHGVSVRRVHVSLQSGGCGGDGSGTGSVDSHAVHSCPCGSVVARNHEGLLKGAPALDMSSKLICAWGGVIQSHQSGAVQGRAPLVRSGQFVTRSTSRRLRFWPSDLRYT